MSCKWLTVAESALEYEVSQATIHRWIKKGKVDFYRIEKTVRVCKTPPGRKKVTPPPQLDRTPKGEY